ncbi:MAG: tyrosine-type recombinase/integrase [Bryobacteraceae bacterium]
MLNLYRRHLKKCKFHPLRQEEQNGQKPSNPSTVYTKCLCPIWCDGEINGRRVRKSLGTRDWARGVKRAEKLETGPEGARIVVSVAEAINSYLGDCRARNLAGSTVEGYSKSLGHLSAFCASRGIRAVDGIDLGALTDFRAGRVVPAKTEDEAPRPISPSTSGKELETLRAFCAFAKKRRWMAENFAQELKPPREDGPPTLPFEADEVEKILDACGKLEDDNPHTVGRTRARARALCLVMLYSGMRISDTIQLRRAAVDLDSGKLLLRVMKTGAPLYVRLGKPATEALAALPGDGEYFFWNGASKLYTAIGNARKTIFRVLAVAGIKGHPHRFRDTFSVSLLEKGENLHTVQLLLGHTSIKTTEKHYAPFVQSFQRVLDAATSKLDFGTKFGTRGKRAAKLLKIG